MRQPPCHDARWVAKGNTLSLTLAHLATLRFRDLNPVSPYPFAVLLLMIGISAALYLPRFRSSLWRQVAAFVICVAVSLYFLEQLTYGRWYADADVELGVLIAMGFSFGFVLSAFYGPSKVMAIFACFPTTYALQHILYSAFDNMHAVFSEDGDGNWVEISDAPFTYAQNTILLIWFIASLTYAVTRIQESIAKSRLEKGHCPQCDYNLRGTPSNSTCPECGESIDWNKVVINEHA